MKALIIRGKYAGHEVEVSQWCNDWFSVMPLKSDVELSVEDREEIGTTPFSPLKLAFTRKDFKEIEEHKNNGMLLKWFDPQPIKNLGSYTMTFSRSKFNPPA